MLGGSYLGIVQWKVAVLNNPYLKAIFPSVSGADDYLDRFYSPGGAMKLGQRLLWMSENLRAPGYHPDFSQFVLHLPLRTADFAATGQTSAMFQEAVAHPSYDAFWKSISVRAQLDKIRVPVFSVGGWFDNFVESDLAAYARLRKRSSVHRILIGPWPHNKGARLEGVDFGADSNPPLRDVQTQWFDQFLKGKDTPLLSKPPVRVFVMGANRWLDTRDWPPRPIRRASTSRVTVTPTRLPATATSSRARRSILPPRRQTVSSSIPAIPFPPMAAPPAAIPKYFPGAPRISAPSSSAATSSSTPPPRSPGISKSSDPSAWSSTPPPPPATPTSPPN